MVKFNCLLIATAAIVTLFLSISILSVQTERTSLQVERESLQDERNSLREELVMLRNVINSLKKNAADEEVVKMDEQYLHSVVSVRTIKESAALLPYIEQNRKTLQKVPKWIEDDVYKKSIYQYGLPEHVKHLIDTPLNNDPTYTDVMTYIADKYLPKEKQYLEIGTSVGKNIYQMVNAFHSSTICIYELEDINPTLENLFTDKNIKEKWSIESHLRSTGLFTEYAYKDTDSTIHYLTSDVYYENSWDRYNGAKFDMIFSDGLHSPEAIMYEMNMLIKRKLFNEEHFVLWYDDMGGDMTTGFFKNFLHLRQTLFPQLNENNIALVNVNGWLGSQEGKHINGIISNLNVHEILKNAQNK